MKSGVRGRALILSTATRSVAVTSGFAGLLKPMWLSLIWAKLKPPASLATDCWPNALELARPAPIVHTTPVPAQAMHSRKPRRSIPSLFFKIVAPVCDTGAPRRLFPQAQNKFV
jgi:hypothetical protein